MSKFRKMIAGILILILSLSMLTACGNKIENNPTTSTESKVEIPEGEPLHPEGVTVPSEDEEHDDEHDIVEFPSEDDNSIYGTVKLFNPTGVYTFTIDKNTIYKVDDEFTVETATLKQNENDFILYESEKEEGKEEYTLKLADNFKVNDTLSIKTSEKQKYETTVSVNTEGGSIGFSSHFATEYAIRIQDEYLYMKDCFAEFAYESILSKEDNRNYKCVQIYGQLDDDIGELKIYYDGVKYIIESNQDIYGLRVAVYNEQTGTDGKLTISEVYGKAFEIIIEESGDATFVRTKR